MKVLITGGTGFVGHQVARAVHSAGHHVHLLVRPRHESRAADFASRIQASLRPGDILDPSSLGQACVGMDAVVHLVGIISEVGQQTFEAVHIGGTANVIAAARSAGIQRFVHMSALGTRPGAASRYHQSKWAAEELVRQSGMNWTVFRPSIIYGPNDAFVNLFAKIIRRSPVVPILGPGTSRFQPVAVECVAQAFARSLALQDAVGKTLNLSGSEVFTLNELIDEILAAMDRRRLKWHLPLGLARFQAWAMEFFLGRLLRMAPPLSRDQITMLQEDNVGDSLATDELFGLRHGRFREGIRSYLKRNG